MSLNVVCQTFTGIVFAVTVAAVIFPRTRLAGSCVSLNYVSVPPLAVLTLFLSSCLSLDTIWLGVRGRADGIEPFSILLLLYGLAYGCISLDVSGTPGRGMWFNATAPVTLPRQACFAGSLYDWLRVPRRLAASSWSCESPPPLGRDVSRFALT